MSFEAELVEATTALDLDTILEDFEAAEIVSTDLLLKTAPGAMEEAQPLGSVVLLYTLEATTLDDFEVGTSATTITAEDTAPFEHLTKVVQVDVVKEVTVFVRVVQEVVNKSDGKPLWMLVSLLRMIEDISLDETLKELATGEAVLD